MPPQLRFCLAIVWMGLLEINVQAAAAPELLPPPPQLAVPSIAPDTSSPWQPPIDAASSHPVKQTDPQGQQLLPTPSASIATDRSADAGHADAGVAPDELPIWYEPAYWLGPTPWDTGIELGINGSSGTSESLSLRTGGYMKRESRFSKLNLSSYYNRTTRSGVATQNNAEFDVRNDWLLDDSTPWTLYGTGNLYYDEFQAFDIQVSANSGVGYRFAHEPGLDLMGRIGGGASREVGGPDDRWVPEALLGFEYSQQLSLTQKFYGKLDYYPEFEQWGEFRLVADTGWEIELVQPSNMSLKISASDRYDSTPNGANPHLVNYSVLLLLKL
jgi:hypothetical protein